MKFHIKKIARDDLLKCSRRYIKNKRLYFDSIRYSSQKVELLNKNEVVAELLINKSIDWDRGDTVTLAGIGSLKVEIQ
jgi:hypothetical protein